MVANDIILYTKERLLKDNGFTTKSLSQ